MCVALNMHNSCPFSSTVSVLSLVVILWLMMMEMMYYLETTFTYTFDPDTDFTQKLKINVDITVAMPCRCKFVTLFCHKKTLQKVGKKGPLSPIFAKFIIYKNTSSGFFVHVPGRGRTQTPSKASVGGIGCISINISLCILISLP